MNKTKILKYYKNISLLLRNYNKTANNNIHIPEAKVIVELRSDTFTSPCEGMRNAMKDAIVGDDVWNEDPTVCALEQRMAEISGKESGLFVASGTMGNLLSVLAHCSNRGSEVLLSDLSHIFNTEQANIAQFGGVQPHPVPTESDGTMDIASLRSRIRSDDFHYPSTELISIENTLGSLGGRLLPIGWIDQLTNLAEEHGLPVHVDGARIFNASVASGLPVSKLVRGVTSASVCFNKGLGAPVGNVVVGPAKFIDKARRLRKGLGGGWRQAGVLAAAALFALENNVHKLKTDHDNAALLANGIDDLGSRVFSVDLANTHSNMVLLNLDKKVVSPGEVCRRLSQVSFAEEDRLGETVSVRACPWGASSVRFVTHLGVSREEVEAALRKISLVEESIGSIS